MACCEDAQRLAHLLEAHQEARVRVAAFGDRHVPVVGLVAEVGGGLADVVGDAGGAQARPGEAEVIASSPRDRGDASTRSRKMRLCMISFSTSSMNSGA